MEGECALVERRQSADEPCHANGERDRPQRAPGEEKGRHECRRAAQSLLREDGERSGRFVRRGRSLVEEGCHVYGSDLKGLPMQSF